MGVFARMPFNKNTMMGVYDGVLMKHEEAAKVMNDPAPLRGEDALRKHYFMDIMLGTEKWIVDGSLLKHWTSYMNSSSSQETATVTLTAIDGVPVFHARKALKPGTECTFYYEMSSGYKSLELVAAGQGGATGWGVGVMHGVMPPPTQGSATVKRASRLVEKY